MKIKLWMYTNNYNKKTKSLYINLDYIRLNIEKVDKNRLNLKWKKISEFLMSELVCLEQA